MKTKITALSAFLILTLALQIIPFSSVTNAANEELSMIQNLRVTATDSHVNIFWDRLPGDKEANIGGYAITWGTRKGEVRSDQIPRQHLTNFSNSMSVRLGTFERRENYYFRVFGYDKDNKYQNNYGSKILEWSYTGSGETKSTVMQPDDPIIVQNNNTSSNTTNTSTAYEFGELRVTAFDTIARFFWSEPTLTDSEYDSIVLIISENNTLENPTLEAEIDKRLIKARIDGLKPGKVYYAAAGYVKNGRKIAQSKTINVNMLPEADANGKRRLNTLLNRIATSEGFGVIIDAKQYTPSTPTNSTETSSNTSTSTSTSTSTTTPRRTTNTSTSSSNSNFVVPNNAKDINEELRRIRKEMGALEVQNRKLILKLREIQQ